MGVLDIFKKRSPYISGLHINPNGNFQYIELKKINTSYFPIVTEQGMLENFAADGIFRKKSFIATFKKIYTQSQSEKLFLNSFTNKKLENEIKSALKIIGFTDISIVPERNIGGIIFSARSEYQRMTVFFHEDEIFFTTTEHGTIVNRDTIGTKDFKVSTVAKLTQHLEQKHIFLAGAKSTMIEPITAIFYQAGIKTHLQNIWENFLHFSDGVPSLFPAESHSFIDVLAITVPDMKVWSETISETTPEKKEHLESVEKVDKKPTEKLFLPKPKKQKKVTKARKKTKDIHHIDIAKREKNTPVPLHTKEKELDYHIEKETKSYLPKRKKMYLPKPKKTGMWKKVKSILQSEI